MLNTTARIVPNAGLAIDGHGTNAGPNAAEAANGQLANTALTDPASTIEDLRATATIGAQARIRVTVNIGTTSIVSSAR